MTSKKVETRDQLICLFFSIFLLSKWILVRKKGQFGYNSIVLQETSKKCLDKISFIKERKKNAQHFKE